MSLSCGLEEGAMPKTSTNLGMEASPNLISAASGIGNFGDWAWPGMAIRAARISACGLSMANRNPRAQLTDITGRNCGTGCAQRAAACAAASVVLGRRNLSYSQRSNVVATPTAVTHHQIIAG